MLIAEELSPYCQGLPEDSYRVIKPTLLTAKSGEVMQAAREIRMLFAEGLFLRRERVEDQRFGVSGTSGVSEQCAQIALIPCQQRMPCPQRSLPEVQRMPVLLFGPVQVPSCLKRL